MTYERDLERSRSNTSESLLDLRLPGRTSRSEGLDRPVNPSTSGLIQRKADADEGIHDVAEHALANADSSRGNALPDELRNKFETSLGTDLSGVRVHTGEASATAASAVSARAYATGNNIHFGANQYDPASSEGQFLIAHEVAHTVQQRGTAAARQNKLTVTEGGDSAEIEADNAAMAMVQGAPTRVSTVSSSAIHRKAFGGFAGTADKRANALGAAGKVSIAPVSIPTDYAAGRASTFEKHQREFEKAEIPGYTGDPDNKKHALYPILGEIREGYLGDVARVTAVEHAYNAFVEPALLAERAMLKFRGLQGQLGFSDDTDPVGDLTANEKSTLAKKFDKEKVNKLKGSIQNKQLQATGLRKELLGTFQSALGAAQGHVAMLEREKATKSGEEKDKIEAKIKSAKEVVDAIIKVVSKLGAAASGGPLGVLKAGGDMALDQAGSMVEAGMERYYKTDLLAIKGAISNATQAASAASKVDDEMRIGAEISKTDGQTDQLAAAMGEWAAAMKELREYYATVAAESEKATGGSNRISQFMVLAAAAADARPHLDAGTSMGASAKTTITSNIANMTPHRGKIYGTAADASYGANKREAEGPDLEQARGCSGAIDGWMTQAEKDKTSCNRVENSIPGS